MTESKTIAETNRFIVLDQYNKGWKLVGATQHEDASEPLEHELNSPEKLLASARVQLQTLYNVQFTQSECLRFVETYFDRPCDNILEKTRKIHDDCIQDFVSDTGHIQNIYLLDKKNVLRNTRQVVQFDQALPPHLAQARLRQRQWDRTEQYPPKNVPTQSEVSHDEAKRLPEDCCICRKVQRRWM